MNLTSCIRLPEDYSAELAAYHASLRGLAQENRDSMGLLAAIFTGKDYASFTRVLHVVALVLCYRA